MALPSNPPASTTPTAFETWAQAVVDTANDHETRIDVVEAAGGIQVFDFDASDLTATTGAPSLGLGIGAAGIRTNTWLMDASSSEGVGRTFLPPSDWTTYDVTLWWTIATAYTGTGVVWQVQRSSWSIGDSASEAESASTAVTATAPAQNIIAMETIASAVPVVAGDRVRMEVVRRPADAGDDVDVDVALIGVTITKAS